MRGKSTQQWNPALLLRNHIPWSNTGQDTHVPPTPWVISQQVDITRCTLEAACWLRLECWRNNVANSHISPGPFNRRVLRFCLVPQCSYLPHWLRHQQCLCELWLDACVLHQWTIFLSSQAFNLFSFVTKEPHYISSTPCHGAWKPTLLSAYLPTEWECTASQIEAHIC